jgi:molecular chaperone DnaJ
MKDYYKILNVSKDANKEDIKKSYRKLDLKFHPDRNPEDEKAASQFKDIAEAYDVLSDKNKKSQYDGAQSGNPFGGMNNFNFQFNQQGFDPFDLFERASGGFGRNPQQEERADVALQVVVDVESAFTGGERSVTIDRRRCCSVCNGTGAEGEVEIEVCPNCNGSGVKITRQAHFQINQTCLSCRGAGKKIKNKCKECQGRTFTLEKEEYNLKIPSGANEGMIIRAKGKGHQKKNKSFGDAFFHIRFRNHTLFKISGENVYSRVPIPIHYIFTGGEFKVKTLHGDHLCHIPPSVDQNYIIEIKGKGFPIGVGLKEHGIHFIEIVYEFPAKELPEEILKKIKEIPVNDKTFPNFNKTQEDL